MDFHGTRDNFKIELINCITILREIPFATQACILKIQFEIYSRDSTRLGRKLSSAFVQNRRSKRLNINGLLASGTLAITGPLFRFTKLFILDGQKHSQQYRRIKSGICQFLFLSSSVHALIYAAVSLVIGRHYEA
jgi:hypothetical protein